MANVRKKKPGAFLFNHLLGVDGEGALYSMSEMHNKAK
jgi:hypothetical protein